jgi:hypothetical protein
MPPGPILIFDKSFLQSLDVDEAVWLDNFFLTGEEPLYRKIKPGCGCLACLGRS